MHLKSQTIHVMFTFLNIVQTQSNTHVKAIRTYNGCECLSNDCSKLLNEKSIIHQRSCPRTPQQNKVVERKHRHILNMASFLKNHSNVPKALWSEYVLIDTYLINRLPIVQFGWQSPYQQLYGRVPYYFHLRKFRCFCFCHKSK